MNETVRIEGKQIALRPITLEDTPLIVRWRSDPQVYGTLFRQEPITEERHRQWLREMVLSGKCDQFIIVDKAQNRSVGTVFLKEIDREHLRAEYAIFIGEETARGRGVGSEAARLMTDYGFQQLGLNRIYLYVFASNVRAIASYRSAGFREEGCLREHYHYKNGSFADVLMMSSSSQRMVGKTHGRAVCFWLLKVAKIHCKKTFPRYNGSLSDAPEF